MTDRTIINAPNVFRPSPAYSHAVVAAGLVFVSGTMAHDAETGEIVGHNEQEQLAYAMRNIALILASAGSSLEKVVSATLIVVEDVDFKAINEEWIKWFPKEPPARQGARFPINLPGVMVSVAVVAMV